MKNNHKKHIVHVITGLNRGGAETLLAEFIKKFNDTNYAHTVLYFRTGPIKEQLVSLNIPTYDIKGLVCLYDPLFWLRMYRLIKQLKPDCIHSWLWSANVTSRIIAKILGITHISAFHNNVEQNGTVRNFLDRLTIGLSEYIVPVSKGIAQSIEKRDSKRYTTMRIINNGIDGKQFYHQALSTPLTRESLAIGPDSYIIGCVGRWVMIKNYSLLLHAVAPLIKNNPKIYCVMIGYGQQETMLKNLAVTLGIANNIRWCINGIAQHYYVLFDCFVQPSIKEGLSIALLEAMSCQLPCIVTHPTFQHDVVINNRNGIVVPSGDVVALTRALVLIITNKSVAKKLAVHAQETVEKNFNSLTMTSLYKALYDASIKSYKNLHFS